MAPNEHATLHTMGLEALAAMGPLIQRIAVALGTIDSVGRTHVNRWGDGSEHFHLWFLARPLGMMQLRGAMIAMWDDLLPAIPADEMQTNLRTLAAAQRPRRWHGVRVGAPVPGRENRSDEVFERLRKLEVLGQPWCAAALLAEAERRGSVVGRLS